MDCVAEKLLNHLAGDPGAPREPSKSTHQLVDFLWFGRNNAGHAIDNIPQGGDHGRGRNFLMDSKTMLRRLRTILSLTVFTFFGSIPHTQRLSQYVTTTGSPFPRSGTGEVSQSIFGAGNSEAIHATCV